MNIQKFDKLLVNMSKDRNVLENTVQELSHYFDNQEIFQFCLSATKDSFFTENKNAYHNSLHTARVLKSIELLLANETMLQKESIVELLFVAALFHDYGHLGRFNHGEAEQEKMAVHLFENKALESNVFSEDEIAVVGIIILATEVRSAVPQALGEYAEMTQWNPIVAMKAIMCEADILSSVTHSCGIENGRLLAQEFNIQEFDTTEGRAKFLRTLSFVTAASQSLGLNDYLENEKVLLET